MSEMSVLHKLVGKIAVLWTMKAIESRRSRAQKKTTLMNTIILLFDSLKTTWHY